MNMRAIFWVDPGVTTGVAWCTVNVAEATAIDALKARISDGSATIPPLTPGKTTVSDIGHQAREIWKLWAKFKRAAVQNALLEPEWVILGMENFILTPNPRHTPGVEGIFPAYVIGAFEGYRQGLYDGHSRNRHITPLILQPASMGMAFNNHKHLDACNCWIKGRQHERAAWAHIIAFLKGNMVKVRWRP